jgi:hypothetical protein
MVSTYTEELFGSSSLTGRQMKDMRRWTASLQWSTGVPKPGEKLTKTQRVVRS